MFISLMKRAFVVAEFALQIGEVPVGAVVVDRRGRVVSSAHNQVVTTRDPTAHAEILAIRKAARVLRTQYLTDCDIYVTLEPCAMCAHAISISRMRRLYFGAYDAKSGGVENGPRVLCSTACHHRPEIYGGIIAEKSAMLLRNFFLQHRKG
ncbi:tRNA-specific adenosine deaminase [Alphaproteobacteria bacterium]